MTGLIVRRLVQLPLILWVVYTLTFVLAWAIPGSPLERPEGRRPPVEVQRAMLSQYALDDAWSFYWSYLGKASGVSWAMGAHDRPFDLGPSLAHRDWTVNEILEAGLPVSIVLGTSALMLACIIGIGAGVVGGVRKGSKADLATFMVAIIGVSVPTFVVGTALLILFGVWWRLAPVGGWGTPGHLVLPALTLSLPFAAYIARLTRFGMIEAMSADYVRTARAKGVHPQVVVWRHALKNAALPVLNYLGPAAAMALTGSFVVEKIFNVPGVGTHFVDGVLNKDLTLVMGVVLVYATLLVLFNLVVDVLSRWADPRIAV